MTARQMSPIQYFGGKGNMVSKIIPLIPRGKVYVEPFFGAGSIFWNIKPFKCEVINDLCGDVINLMRCLQDEKRAKKLHERLAFTMYSLDELRLSIDLLKNSNDDDERAWAFYVNQNQGFSGGGASCAGNWGRAFISRRGMAARASKWWSRFDQLENWHKRLARVQIDNRDALEVIKYWDSVDTVFYLDPPYVTKTRQSGGYKHECTDNFHEKLVEILLDLQGQFVLSGYDDEIYNQLSEKYETVSYKTACFAAGKTRNSGLQGKGAAFDKVPRIEKIWTKRDYKMNGGLI